MSKLCLIVLACMAYMVTAQECPTAAVNDFLKCVETAAKSQQDAMKAKGEEMKKKHEELQQKLQGCFTSNGCTAPEKPPGGGSHGKGKGGPSSSGSVEKTPEEREKARACGDAIHQKVEQRVQSCVAANTGVNLPSFSGMGGHGGPGGPHGPHGFGGKGKGKGKGRPGRGDSSSSSSSEEGDEHKAHAKEFITNQCNATSDASAAADKVLQCLNDTFTAAKAEWKAAAQSVDHSKPPPELEQFCSAKNSCLATLNTAGCNETQLMKVVGKAVVTAFDCAKNETAKIKETKEDLAAGVDQCNGVNLTHAQKGPGGYEHAFGPSPPKFGPGKGKGKGKGKGEGAFGGHGFQDPCNVFKGQQEEQHDFGRGGWGGPSDGPSEHDKNGRNSAAFAAVQAHVGKGPNHHH